MAGKQVEDYLKEGMYGKKEWKPEERNIYLGTYRERVELALTTGQVMTEYVYPQVDETLQTTPGLKVLLNGDIAQSYILKYIQTAERHHAPFTLVRNEKNDTPIGLVLSHEHSVDKTHIFIEDDISRNNLP